MEGFRLPEEYFRQKEKSGDFVRKEQDMRRILEAVSREELRAKTYRPASCPEEWKDKYEKALTEEGIFRDLKDEPADWETALKRLAFLIVSGYHYKDRDAGSRKEGGGAEAGSGKGEALKNAPALPERLLRGVIRYGEREMGREDKGNTRFHGSIFAIPVCAVNIYFALLPLMDSAEESGELMTHFRNVLYGLMLQAWTLPLRGDETDATPFWVERFRNHVWWMGGNAVGYRPVFHTALCFGDSRLMDIMGEVIIGATASRAACGEDSFWTEGICADGFGWGHGAQAYNDGYPTDALSGIFSLMKHFRGTVYEYVLREIDWKNVVRFIGGISWSSYGDYVPPMMGRRCFQASREGRVSTTALMKQFAEEIVARYEEYVPEEELRKLKAVLSEGEMNVSDGNDEFHGTRYFFNNDTLISKNKRRYFYFNTASRRCKGVECAADMADTRNFYIRDGSYLILTDTESYEKAKGTFNPSHFPGTTERDLDKSEIMEETNWSGYNSSRNFAGGLGEGSRGAAGFIYEKSAEREADGAGIVRNDFTKEMLGVEARKAVFVWEDLFVFLGAGIRDNRPEYGRRIITTVNNVRFHEGRLIDRDGGDLGELTGGESMSGGRYFRNDGVLYGIEALPGSKISVAAEMRTTDWSYLNFTNRETEDEELKMLEITVDHGLRPGDGSYRYWMCTDPGISPARAEEMFTVLGNTARVQAVCFEGRTAFAVFYEAGELDCGEYMTEMSESCILMAEHKNDGSVRILLCDPCQRKDLTHITVSLKRKADHSVRTVRVPLPGGGMRGSKAEAVLQ